MQLTALTNQPTMSSREIAELVESRHDSVKRSMETLRDKGIISFTQAVETSHEGAGARPVDIFMVNKRDSYVVVAQLSPEFTARLVDRWQELEAASQYQVPQTRAGLLRLALEQEEKIEAQALLLEQQQPAVEFVDRFVEAKSAKGFREVAKILGIPEREFIKGLADQQIIFKQGANWLPMAEHQKNGRFTVKTGESNGHAFTQTRFTPEGIAWIAKRVAKRGSK